MDIFGIISYSRNMDNEKIEIGFFCIECEIRGAPPKVHGVHMNFLVACGIRDWIDNSNLVHGFFCFELYTPKKSEYMHLLCGTTWPEDW